MVTLDRDGKMIRLFRVASMSLRVSVLIRESVRGLTVFLFKVDEVGGRETETERGREGDGEEGWKGERAIGREKDLREVERDEGEGERAIGREGEQ